MWFQLPPVASLRFATGGYSQAILNRIEAEYRAINFDAVALDKESGIAIGCGYCVIIYRFVSSFESINIFTCKMITINRAFFITFVNHFEIYQES